MLKNLFFVSLLASGSVFGSGDFWAHPTTTGADPNNGRLKNWTVHERDYPGIDPADTGYKHGTIVKATSAEDAIKKATSKK